MKKYIILILISLLSTFVVFAKPVSVNEAKVIAEKWYSYQIQASALTVENVLTFTHEEIVTSYVFLFKAGGFVIVAGDDASIPILGYSTNNSFPDDNLCPAVNNWLDNYNTQISDIVKSGLSNKETMKQWDAIKNGLPVKSLLDVGPLLETTWAQGCFYNELCPVEPAGPCGHVFTGCVATAMAQIMKYHNFPPQGVGSHSYIHPVYGLQSADFENTVYDWAAMPNSISSSNSSVATLMYHSGVSVDMNYSAYGSGAEDEFILIALIDYFNYESSIKYHYQSEYPDIEIWKDLLRSDLDENLPVIYCGDTTIDGHAFICDGYSLIDGLFHFNWGWGGNYNGMYAIGTLNPNQSYNFSNRAMFQIKPGNSDLINRIIAPASNEIFHIGSAITIEAETIYGVPELMKITIDGITKTTGTSTNISFTWNTTQDDLGSHDVRAWSFAGADSAYYAINLNVSDWIPQTSGFEKDMTIDYISAIDTSVAWAISWWSTNQDFTKTINGGGTWEAGSMVNCEGLVPTMIFGISATKAYVTMLRFSGSNPMGIYVTSDGGNSWQHQPTASFYNPWSYPNCVHFFNDQEGWCMGDPNLMTGNFEMYTTNNGGANWIQVPDEYIPLSLPGECGITGSYSAVNDTIWFGTFNGRIFKSTDRGHTWNVFDIPTMLGELVTPVFQNGEHGLVHNFLNQLFPGGGPGAICETFDGGETWFPVNYSGPMHWSDLAYVPDTENTWVSSGSYNYSNCPDGASVSLDGGHTWSDFPGTSGAKFLAMDWVSPLCGWAGSYSKGTENGGMYKFIGNPDTTLSSISPEKFFNNSLNVYPNPVLSETTIELNIPQSALVVLSLYDISGKFCERIFYSKLTSGLHNIEWNAEGLPTGIYFLRLETNDQIVTKKIILIN